MAIEKMWTHEGTSEKKVGHMKVQEKKKKIVMSTKESKERERERKDQAKWSYNKLDGNN
jgi:hypothetical protein